MQTGGSGAQATSSGAAGRGQVRIFMCPLFGNRRNEDGSAGKTGLSDCLISGPYRPLSCLSDNMLSETQGFRCSAKADSGFSNKKFQKDLIQAMKYKVTGISIL